MSDYFAKVIFRAVGYNIDDEIPMPAIQQAINSGCEEADLLAMFCGADTTD
jgi:hypothetical protein